MKIFISAFFFITVFVTQAISQVDYLDFKERFSLSCHESDSTKIVENTHLLDSLQSVTLTGGQQEYLYDYGWTYYTRYLKWNDIEDLQKAVLSFDRGWEEFEDLGALWNSGGMYRELGDCNKSLELTEAYIEHFPEDREVDYQQVYLRYKFCRNQ